MSHSNVGGYTLGNPTMWPYGQAEQLVYTVNSDGSIAAPISTPKPEVTGDIVFQTGDTERLRLCGDGTICVGEREIESDLELVKAFRAFLQSAGYYLRVDAGAVLRTGKASEGGGDITLTAEEPKDAAAR